MLIFWDLHEYILPIILVSDNRKQLYLYCRWFNIIGIRREKVNRYK